MSMWRTHTMIVIPINVVLTLSIWTIFTFLSTSWVRMPRIGIASVGSFYLISDIGRPPSSTRSDCRICNSRCRTPTKRSHKEELSIRVNSADWVSSDICIDISPRHAFVVTWDVFPRRINGLRAVYEDGFPFFGAIFPRSAFWPAPAREGKPFFPWRPGPGRAPLAHAPSRARSGEADP